MALIKRRPKELLKPVTLRLPESVIERLAAYSEFTNVSQSDIVATAVNYAIDSDKDFAAETLRLCNTNCNTNGKLNGKLHDAEAQAATA